MVQCSHCAIWHHLDCVDLHRSESIGVWPCPRCRCQTDILQQCQRALQDVSSQVVALQLLQDEVHKGLAKLMHVKTLEQSNLDLVKLIGSKICECDDLKAKNANILTKFFIYTECTDKVIELLRTLNSVSCNLCSIGIKHIS